jgi:hypothetical protein
MSKREALRYGKTQGSSNDTTWLDHPVPSVSIQDGRQVESGKQAGRIRGMRLR